MDDVYSQESSKLYVAIFPEFLLENAHALAPAIVLWVDKDVVWESVCVLGGDGRDVVFVLLHDIGDLQDGVAEGSLDGSSGGGRFYTTMSAGHGRLRRRQPTLMGARRGEGDVQRPRLPDEVLIFCAKPSLPSLAFPLTELDDNLAASVLILIVGVGVDLADELVDTLFNKRLEVDILDPGYGNV